MTDKIYEGIAKFAEAVLAIQADPKKTKSMIEEINNNFALTEDIVKKYNDALDTIAEAKVSDAKRKKVEDALLAKQEELSNAQAELALAKINFEGDKKALKDQQTLSKAYDAELASLKISLDSRENTLNGREKKLDSRESAVKAREDTVSVRESTFEQAKALMG